MMNRFWNLNLNLLILALAAFWFGGSLLALGSMQADKPTKPDNTKVNRGDAGTQKPTSGDQKENKADLEITQNIRRAITTDKSMSTYARNIKIITQDGHVTLRGPVRTEQEKQDVTAKAMEIAGKDHVKSEIQVAPKKADDKKSATTTAKTKEIVSDATILTKIKTQFVTDGIIGTNVDVTNGHVILKGKVENAQEKSKAEAIAKKTDGVKSVKNLLVATKKIDDKKAATTMSKTKDTLSDATILTKIKTQLVADGIIGTNVDVTNGHVVLKGEVENAREKSKAEAIAKKTDGVKSVKNQLTVQPPKP